jgi:hypothetical protein
VVEAAAHTALHASLNATLHTTLDLSQRMGRHHQDRGCENPLAEHGCVVVWHSVNHCTVGSLENSKGKCSAKTPLIDEQTLVDTVEGLTDLHEIVAAIVRAALADEALASGLKGRIAEMQDRLDRLQDCAAKRRQIAKDVMIELDIKKITAPDFTVSIRPGMPSLLVLDEVAVPSIYWQPVAPRLNRQGLLSELKEGADIQGVALSNPEPVLSVRTR